jgi:hypothetical protein
MSDNVGRYKLFEVYYLDEMVGNSYLAVGDPDDTEQIIREREIVKLEKRCSCLMWCSVREMSEVDGHKIIVI